MKVRVIVLLCLLLAMIPSSVSAGNTDSPVMVNISHPEVMTYGGRAFVTTLELRNFERQEITFKSTLTYYKEGRGTNLHGLGNSKGTTVTYKEPCADGIILDKTCSIIWEGKIPANENVTLNIDPVTGNVLGSHPFLDGTIEFSNLSVPMKIRRDIYLTTGTGDPEAQLYVFAGPPDNPKNKGQWKTGTEGTVSLEVRTPTLTDFYRTEFYSTCGIVFDPEPTLDKSTYRSQVRRVTLPKDAPLGPCRIYGWVGMWDLGVTLTPEFIFDVVP